jgi:wyosine [tRNA(Phe)-imidazoG37] synthetase (radical SAM superfamily)
VFLRSAAKGGSVTDFIYGPVPSRRLGVSLGLDVVPAKVCSLNCVYCQLGPTATPQTRRRRFFAPTDFFSHLERRAPELPQLDYATFSGSGEPTLNADLGALIRGTAQRLDAPTCVITNGTLTTDPELRRELTAADLLLPSLDAADQPTFERINRPAAGLEIAAIIDGLCALRRESGGRFWLEIMLVAGLNDNEQHLEKLRAAVERIDPDLVQLNTVVRPPVEESARPLAPERLREIAAAFDHPVEVIAGFHGATTRQRALDLEREVLTYLGRRPGRIEDLAAMLGQPAEAVAGALKQLVSAGRVRLRRMEAGDFYVPRRNTPE